MIGGSVQALLRADEAGEQFLSEQPRGQPSVTVAEQPGGCIGRYKLLEKIGEGGCGVVYLADQQEPVKRQVALKIIKPGMDTRQVLARFEAERQALALMDHPNIAKVLYAGATDMGRPYFVMELVQGLRITEYRDQHCLSTTDRLELFMQVCHALQHAHQKGIIHRDLKPSNILVTRQDGVAVPKVIDFGIAKATGGLVLTNKTAHTAFDQFLGTPAYMSPEQAQAGGVDIDTRSDIYNLGVLLYELLTGTTPFETKELVKVGLDEMRRIIREREPIRPSTRLNQTRAAQALGSSDSALRTPHSAIDPDLDWIVMKCLDKDRSRRYDTANGLAMDLERFLSNEPVVATPPSRFYRLRKFGRRHRVALAVVTITVALLLAGIAGTTWQMLRARRAESLARNEAATSRQIAHFLQDTFKAVAPSLAQGRDTKMLRDLMDRAAERLGQELKDQPVAEAEMRATIGEVYAELGEYAKAEAMHRDALKLATRSYGMVHPEVASALDNLSVVLYRQGKAAEAEALERKVLAMRIKTLGKAHPQVAMSLLNLAAFLQAEGKLAEAETVSRQALDANRKAFGNETQYVTTALNNLGCVLCLEGKLAEAEAIVREVVAIEKKLLGNEHPDVATSLQNLAKILADESKIPEAEALYRQVLALRRKLLGDDHPDVAQTLDSLAGTVQDRGSFAEAETMCREALAIRQKRLGAEHPDVARSLCNLARLLRRQHKSAEAETMLREALATQGKLIGSDNPDVALSLEQLAGSLADQGRLAEAEAPLRECLSIREKRLPDDWLTFSARSALGENLMAHKQYAEAEPLLISGYNGLRDREARIPAPNKPRLHKAAERLIRFYEETAQPDKAAEWKQELAELTRPASSAKLGAETKEK